MYRIEAKRDYPIYVYGLDIAGIEYIELRSESVLLITDKHRTEVEIMKNQLLADGVFSTETGQTPDIPVKYDFVYEINKWCIYRVLDPHNDIFNGINAQLYQFTRKSVR